MNDERSSPSAVSHEHLEKVLNQHGIGFHYSVVRAIAAASANEDRWAWRVEEVELPVEVRGGPTHIDILLKHKYDPAYLVAECKRANPKLSRWCFFKAPYAPTGQVIVEAVRNLDDNPSLSVSTAGMHALGYGDTYHISVELRTQGQGEPTGGKGRGAIEEAATQVMRHLNGFVGLAVGARQYLAGLREIFIMPTIFTTARLFTCDADLSRADLHDGRLDLAGSSIKEVSWLYYQYRQSPGLKHEVRSKHKASSLREYVMAEFSRTIGVVNASGIEEFLKLSAGLW